LSVRNQVNQKLERDSSSANVNRLLIIIIGRQFSY
jgi:hypothetical protein